MIYILIINIYYLFIRMIIKDIRQKKRNKNIKQKYWHILKGTILYIYTGWEPDTKKRKRRCKNVRS